MENKKRDILLWTDLILTALAAAWIYYLLARCQEYLSFAGFAALIAMAILLPGFLCLLLELFLLYAGSRGRSWCLIAAYLLQIVAALPSLFLLSIDPVLFDGLLVYPALMVLGIIGLLRTLVRRRRQGGVRPAKTL